MGWRQVVAWWLVAGVLAIVYPRVTARRSEVDPDPRAGRQPVLRLDVASLSEIVLEHGGRRMVARRTDGGWAVEEPPGATVPSDLVAALASAVAEAEVIEQVGGGGDLTSFGLGGEATRLELRRSGGAPETLWLGGDNPSGTAVYARVLGGDGVLLVGRTLRYYADLVVEALPKAQVPSDTVPGKVGSSGPLTLCRRAV